MSNLPPTSSTPLTTKQVADLLTLSISQVARYGQRVQATKLPGKTGSYIFTADEVDKIRALQAGETIDGEVTR